VVASGLQASPLTPQLHCVYAVRILLQRDMASCFKAGRMEMVYLPPGHPQHPLTSQLYGNSSNARQLLWWSIVSRGQALVESGGNLVSRGKQMAADVGTKFVSVVAGAAGGVLGRLADAMLPNPIGGTAEEEWGVFSFNFNPGTRQAAERSITLLSSGSRGGAGASLTCDNCYARLSAGLRFVLDLEIMAQHPYARVNHLLAEVWGDLEVNADLVATVRAAVDAKFEWMGPRMSNGGLEVVLGRVPIPIRADLALSLGALVTAHATGTASVGFDYQYSIRQGVEYRASWGGMEPVRSPPSRGMNFRPPKVNLAGAAQVEVQVRPIIYLILFGSSTITLTPSPYVGVDLRLAGQGGPGSATAMVEYDMYYGMDLRLALEKIGIMIPLIKFEFTFGGRFLPWATNIQIMDKTYPGTSWSRGRLALAGSLGASSDGRGGSGSGASGGGSGSGTGSASPSPSPTPTPSGSGSGSGSGSSSGGSGSGGFSSLISALGMLTSTEGLAYATSEWHPCNQPCSGGLQQRNVSCVRRDRSTQAQSAVSLGRCLLSLGPLPPLLQACNTQACAGSAACPTSCRATNPANCPASGCGVAGCQGLPCYLTQQAAARCAAATSCASCITAGMSCGWCTDSSRCLPGSGLLPDAPGVCSAAGWQVTTCSAREPQLNVLTPAAGSNLTAGQLVTVQWTGGPPTTGQVQLALRCDNANASFTGFGLPGSGINNTNTFQWRVAAGIPQSRHCQLVITSLVDPTNFDLTDGYFGVDGLLTATAWSTGTWSNCTSVCGGGTRSRSVQCRDLRGGLVVASSACDAARRPPASETCNAIPCASQCLAQLIASVWTWEPCRCLRQNNNQGFFCGTVLINTATGETQSTGCDTRGSDYQHCCRQQG
jgi:hypothetical protein